MLLSALLGISLLARCALSAPFQSFNASSVRRVLQSLSLPQKHFSPLDLRISLLEANQRCSLNSHNFKHVILKEICTAREVGIFPFPWDL